MASFSTKNILATAFLVLSLFVSQLVMAGVKNSVTSFSPETTAFSNSPSTPDLVVSRLLKLYPNPNSGYDVSIKGFHKNSIASIQVKNAIGYSVVNERLYTTDDKGSVTIDISNLQKGHYYLHIRVEGAQVIKKLIRL